jgi:hypothetical protein
VVVETNPGPLNRVAVFFRLVLLVPVYLLATWLSAGLGVSMIVIWIVVLAKGRMPGVVAQAIAATLRFIVRTWGYGMLVTSAYPSGLYGEPEDVAVPLAQAAPVEGASQADAAPVMPVARPRTARLQLSKGARRLVTTFLVIGIIQNVTTNALNVRAGEVDRSGQTTIETRTVD